MRWLSTVNNQYLDPGPLLKKSFTPCGKARPFDLKIIDWDMGQKLGGPCTKNCFYFYYYITDFD
jgi:hypothetical protein